MRVHHARSTMLVMLVLGPLLWMLGMPLPHVLLGALGGGRRQNDTRLEQKVRLTCQVRRREVFSVFFRKKLSPLWYT